MTKSRQTLRRALLGTALAGILTLAACGGDDDGSSNDDDTEETTNDDSTDETTADDSTDETTADDSGDSGDAGALNSEECLGLLTQFNEAIAGAATGTDLEKTEELFDELADSMPDDLSDDVEKLQEGYGKLAEVYQRLGNDPTKVATDPEAIEILQELSTTEFVEASTNVSTYLQTECGVAG